MDELDDAISALSIDFGSCESSSKRGEITAELLRLRTKKKLLAKKASAAASSALSSSSSSSSSSSAPAHEVAVKNNISNTSNGKSTVVEDDDAEEIVTPGAQKQINIEEQSFDDVPRFDPQAARANSILKQERIYTLHHFRHMCLAALRALVEIQTTPVVYASTSQRDMWFPPTDYRPEPHILTAKLSGTNIPSSSLSSSSSGTSSDSSIYATTSADPSLRAQLTKGFCPSLETCPVRRAHFGLHSRKTKPSAASLAALAAKDAERTYKNDAGDMCIQFETHEEMVEHPIRLMEDGVVRVRDCVRSRFQQVQTVMPVAIVVFVEQQQQQQKTDGASTTIVIHLQFIMAVHPLQHELDMVQMYRARFRTEFSVKDRGQAEEPYDCSASNNHRLQFPANVWKKAPTQLEMACGRFTTRLDYVVQMLQDTPFRVKFSERQWHTMVFHGCESLLSRGRWAGGSGGAGAPHAPSGAGAGTTHAPDNGPSVENLSATGGPGEPPGACGAPAPPSGACGAPAPHEMRGVLQRLFETQRSAPSVVGMLRESESNATRFPAALFETWTFDASLQSFLSGSVDPYDTYLVWMRTVFCFLSAMRNVHIPHGPWSLYVGFNTDSFRLRCLLVVNRADRRVAEERYRMTSLLGHAASKGSDASDDKNLLSMSGVEQALVTWLHATYPDIVIPVCSLTHQERLHAYPLMQYEMVSDHLDVCRVPEKISDPTRIFTPVHLARLYMVVQRMMEKITTLPRTATSSASSSSSSSSTSPTAARKVDALGIFFSQGKRTTDAVLGIHWLIRIELALWTKR